MPDRRHWRLYLAVCVLLLVGLFLTLSVLDYDPSDLPSAVYPAPAAPHNRLGSAGALIAHELRQTLGVAVYVFLAGWFVVVGLLVLRRGWLAWSVRFVGWLLLVPATAVLAERWPQPVPWPATSPLGSGGSLGAWLDAWFRSALQPAMQPILLGCCVALGAILALDVVLLRLLRLLWWCVRVNFGVAHGTGKRPVPRPRSAPPIVRTTPLTEPEEIAESEEPLPPTEEPQEPPARPHIIPIHHHDEIAHRDHPAPHVFAASRRRPETSAISDRERFADYELPPLTLLEDAEPFPYRSTTSSCAIGRRCWKKPSPISA